MMLKGIMISLTVIATNVYGYIIIVTQHRIQTQYDFCIHPEWLLGAGKYTYMFKIMKIYTNPPFLKYIYVYW